MKKYFALLLLIGTVLGAAPLRGQDANPDRVTVSWSDPSRPGLLKVNLLSGGITVKTHTGNDVIVEAKEVRGNRRPAPADAGGLRRIDANTSGVIVEEQNNEMKIGTNNFRGACCTSIEIQVPAKTNLNLQTLNGGDIVVDGVEGAIEVTNTNGGVSVNNVAGSVVAHSLNGKVTVSLRQITSNKPMSFTSMNGN